MSNTETRHELDVVSLSLQSQFAHNEAVAAGIGAVTLHVGEMGKLGETGRTQKSLDNFPYETACRKVFDAEATLVSKVDFAQIASPDIIVELADVDSGLLMAIESQKSRVGRGRMITATNIDTGKEEKLSSYAMQRNNEEAAKEYGVELEHHLFWSAVRDVSGTIDEPLKVDVSATEEEAAILDELVKTEPGELTAEEAEKLHQLSADDGSSLVAMTLVNYVYEIERVGEIAPGVFVTTVKNRLYTMFARKTAKPHFMSRTAARLMPNRHGGLLKQQYTAEEELAAAVNFYKKKARAIEKFGDANNGLLVQKAKKAADIISLTEQVWDAADTDETEIMDKLALETWRAEIAEAVLDSGCAVDSSSQSRTLHEWMAKPLHTFIEAAVQEDAAKAAAEDAADISTEIDTLDSKYTPSSKVLRNEVKDGLKRRKKILDGASLLQESSPLNSDMVARILYVVHLFNGCADKEVFVQELKAAEVQGEELGERLQGLGSAKRSSLSTMLSFIRDAHQNGELARLDDAKLQSFARAYTK